MDMKNLFPAIVLSLVIHALVAGALIAYLEYAPHPDVLATLDLSSVKLSFSEQVAETQPVAAAPEILQQKVRPSVAEKPPEVKPEKPVHRELGEVGLPEPKEDARLKTEDAKAVNAPSVAPRQARLDAPPKPKRNIKPDYPRGARQRGEQGDVVLEIRVNAEGAVDEVKVAVSSGFAELDAAAVKAAKAAKFSPARSGRDPVASTARLKLQFKLR